MSSFMIPSSSAYDVNEDTDLCSSGVVNSGLGVLTLFAGAGVKPKPGVFADAFMWRFLVLELDLAFGY